MKLRLRSLWRKLIKVAPAAGVLIFAMSTIQMTHKVIVGEAHYFGGDFVSFYSAGRMALRGDTQLSYDMKEFGREVAKYDPKNADKLLWSYPPSMFLFVTPFAVESILVASVLWTVLSLLLFLYSVFRIYPHWSVLGIILGSPSIIKIVIYGQASLFFAAALGIGLVSMSRKRDAWGGAILSGATLKPHLSLFVPAFLFLEQDYRAMAAFVATPLVALLIAVGIFGPGSLSGFFGGLFGKTIPYLYERLNFRIMASPYAAFRLWGVAQDMAMYGHVLFAAVLVSVSIYLLRSRAPVLLKGALAIPTTLVMSPYLYEYDLAALTITLVILYRLRGEVGSSSFDIATAVVSAFALFPALYIPPAIPLPLIVLLMVYVATARKLVPFWRVDRAMRAQAPSEKHGLNAINSASRAAQGDIVQERVRATTGVSPVD